MYRHTDRAAPAAEPVVAFEGGPGYPSIGSAESYLFMLGQLHRTHDLIVMDQRGTGGSSVIDCPALQNGVGVYEQAAAACARQLGMRAGAFGSAAVADDLAAILRGLRHRQGGCLRRLLRQLRRPGVHAAPPGHGARGGARRHL